MWRRLLRVVVAAVAVVGAWAHGNIVQPVPRNYKSGTFCDHCLNSGGPGVTLKYPNGRHGVCGDNPEDPINGAGYHEGGGKFQQIKGYRETYFHAGDIMRVKGIIEANHLGHFEYFLCPLPAGAKGIAERPLLTDACFARNPLKVMQDGAWGTRYYIHGKVGAFENAVKLPDMECPRCVLRWYYVTGNSCKPPGTPPKWAKPSVETCGTSPLVPEEFWNCADIVLLKKNAPLPPVTTTKFKGELTTGEAVNNTYVAPGDQDIDNTDNEGDFTGNSPNEWSGGSGAGSGGGGSGDDGDLVSFPNVMISVMIGTGVGMPLILFRPLIGVAVGLFGFIAALVFFMVRNNSEGFVGHPDDEGPKGCKHA